MAYPNKNKKKNINNVFTQGIQQGGPNFLDEKNSRELEMDAIRVFRSLARGQVDITAHGHYFLHEAFLNSCISAANSKLIFHNISFTGVQSLMNDIRNQGQIPDSNIIVVLDHHKKCAEAYNIIYSNLNHIVATRNINYLVCMADMLESYRNYV